MKGKKKKDAKIYTRFVVPLDTQCHRVGTYAGLPSIVSVNCTGVGIYYGADGGRQCQACKDLRSARGSNNPSVRLNSWYRTLALCIERRKKDTLTQLDIEAPKKFAKISEHQLTKEGRKLKEESQAIVDYASCMAKIAERMPEQTF